LGGKKEKKKAGFECRELNTFPGRMSRENQRATVNRRFGKKEGALLLPGDKVNEHRGTRKTQQIGEKEKRQSQMKQAMKWAKTDRKRVQLSKVKDKTARTPKRGVRKREE